MAWICDLSMLGKSEPKDSLWNGGFFMLMNPIVQSAKKTKKQTKVHGNLPRPKKAPYPGLWRNVPWNLSFRFSLTLGSVFPWVSPTGFHGPPSLTLCSSRAAGFGTLAKNSCSKVVRSNSTSCEVGFSFTNPAAILEGRFDCFPHRFLFGAPIKTCMFLIVVLFGGSKVGNIFHHLV